MATLKELKTRIGSVSSTKKITSAMKMIAAARLRQAQLSVEASRPYALGMQSIMSHLADGAVGNPSPLLVGKKQVQKILLIVISSERGLCAGFNTNAIREARRKIALLRAAQQEVKLLCIGRKATAVLKYEFSDIMIENQFEVSSSSAQLPAIQQLMTSLISDFQADKFDKAYIIYNHFVNAITQKVLNEQLIPVKMPETQSDSLVKSMELEPNEKELIADILPKSLVNHLYCAMLDSYAAEQAARMTAMDNASRNAGDMIKDLTLYANRQRQAAITTELTEIISGAEAV